MNETINQTLNATGIVSTQFVSESKTIFQYTGNGLSWAIGGLRENLINLIDKLGFSGNLWVPIIILVFSLFLGFKIVTKFVTTPFSSRYIIWYLIVSLLIFSALTYI